MPTVQAPPGQQAFSTETPRIQTSVEDFGGGQAARPFDLSGPEHVAQQVYQQQKQDANEIAVTDAGAKLSALETTILWDPQTGAMTRKGKDAFGAQDDATKAWQAQSAALEDGLQNDQQKLAFRRMVAAHGASLNETLTRHVATEKEAYDSETTNGFVTNERNAAIANFTDPQRITESVRNQQAALADYARRTGKPAEWLQQQALQAASDTHVAVIDRLLANDQDVAAKTYRDAHADEIVGAHAATLDKALEEGSSRAESQRQSDAILQAGGTLTEQVAKAREIENPRVRDLVEQRVRRTDSENKAAQREAAEASMVTAGNIIDQTRDASRIPPSMWANFTPAQKSSLKSYADQLQGGGQVKTDWSSWVSLRDMASNPATRQAFLDLDPMSYRSKLADAQFTEITALREGLRNQDTHAIATADNVAKVHGVIAGTLKGIGIGVDPKKRMPDAAIAETVYRSVNDQVEQLQEKQKSPATTKQVQEITDELVTQHLVNEPGRFWGTNQVTKRTFELQPQDEVVVTPQDISPANRTAIAGSLRRRGMPVTQAAILNEYQQHIKGLVRRGPQ